MVERRTIGAIDSVCGGLRPLLLLLLLLPALDLFSVIPPAASTGCVSSSVTAAVAVGGAAAGGAASLLSGAAVMLGSVMVPRPCDFDGYLACVLCGLYVLPSRMLYLTLCLCSNG